jgi:hypothetical protein
VVELYFDGKLSMLRSGRKSHLNEAPGEAVKAAA